MPAAAPRRIPVKSAYGNKDHARIDSAPSRMPSQACPSRLRVLASPHAIARFPPRPQPSARSSRAASSSLRHRLATAGMAEKSSAVYGAFLIMPSTPLSSLRDGAGWGAKRELVGEGRKSRGMLGNEWIACSRSLLGRSWNLVD